MSTNAIESVGDIRGARLAAGLSQQKLAGSADCSISMVRLVEAGYRPEPSAAIERIVSVLNDETPARQPTSRENFDRRVGDGHAAR
jgi:transcriptional regulator with XRE-family HTH domain